MLFPTQRCLTGGLRYSFALVLLGLFWGPAPSFAQTQAITTTGGSWLDASTWSCNCVPNNGYPKGASYDVEILGGAVTLDTSGATAIGLFSVAPPGELGLGSPLDVLGSAPSTLEGSINIFSRGSLTYSGGGEITQIGDGTNQANLILNGPSSGIQVAVNGSIVPDVNSGLTSLATIASNASLQLYNGAAVTLSGSLTNASNGALSVVNGSTLTVHGNFTNDSAYVHGGAYVYGDSGPGSTLNIGGNLTNTGTLIIGLPSQTSASTVTVGGSLDNTGTLTIDPERVGNPISSVGSTMTVAGSLTNSGYISVGEESLAAGALSALNVGGAAPSTLTGTYNLSAGTGGAAVEFGSGGITQVGDGTNAANLILSGQNAYVELSSAPGSNSALTGLGTIAANSSLQLYNAATVSVSSPILIAKKGALYLDTTGSGGSTFDAFELTNEGSIFVDSPDTDTKQTTISVFGDLSNDSGGGIQIGATNMTGSATVNAGGDIFNYSNAHITLTSDGKGAAAKLVTKGSLTNDGTLAVDPGGPGGSTLMVGTILTNTDSIQIGNSRMIAGSTVKIGLGIDNTGSVELDGGSVAGAEALLSAAYVATSLSLSTTLVGDYTLNGNKGGAIVKLTGGFGIQQVGDGTNPANLILNGGNAYMELGNGPSGNSALAGLSIIAGKSSLQLNNGATVVVSPSLTNESNSALYVVNGSTLKVHGNFTNNATYVSGGAVPPGAYVYGDSGPGSTLSVGGMLTNTGTLGIGYPTQTSASTVTVGGKLDNTGSVSLTGATLTISGSLTNASKAALYVVNGSTLTVHGNFTNDAAYVSGGAVPPGAYVYGGPGSTLNIGGNLTNTGTLSIGYPSQTSASTVTVAGSLDNTGTLTIDPERVGNPVSSVGSTMTVAGSLTNSGYISVGEESLAAGALSALSVGRDLTTSGAIDLTGGSTGSTVGGLASLAANANVTITSTGSLRVENNAEVDVAGNLSNNGSITMSNNGFLNVSRNVTNSGFIGIGSATQTSASEMSVGGVVTNSASFSALVGIVGGSTSGATALLNVSGSAPSTLAGLWAFFGNTGGAEAEFGSGAIAQIGTETAFGELVLLGSNALIQSNHLTGNSALAGLTDIGNYGQLDLGDGVTITTVVSLTNGGFLGVDDSVASGGGSTLNVGGNLSNTNRIYVGSANQTVPTLLKVAGAFTNAGASILSLIGTDDGVIAGSFSNSGTVSVASGSSLTLSATGAYTQTAGATDVNGTLIAPGGVNINGGTLSGSGTVNGSVVNGATVYPGDPVTLTINGNYTQNVNGTLLIDISSATDFTKLDVNGNATLGGTVDFDFLNGYVPGANTDFAFLNVTGSVSGNFTGFDFSGINCPSCTFNLSSLSLDTGSIAPTATPEPASLLLFGTGLLALGFGVWARRAHAT